MSEAGADRARGRIAGGAPIVSVSAICTYQWALEQDLAFYAAHDIRAVGVSLAKLERHGVEDGATRVRDAGLRVTNLIGLGPFHLDDPDQWPNQRDRLLRAIDAAVTIDAECMVLTTGPAGALPWEDAADRFADALGPVLDASRRANIPIALEHTNSLRVDVGFVHTLHDAIDLARRLDIGVCMEINACWAERGLAGTIAADVDRIRLVQVSDYAVGTLTTPARLVPGDGDIPIARILGQVLDAGYRGSFDLELIGPAIEEEGYERAVPRAITALDAQLGALARG
jgi:sugar phosphate isomerase/epimerase